MLQQNFFAEGQKMSEILSEGDNVRHNKKISIAKGSK
jgi:hypothetical protein